MNKSVKTTLRGKITIKHGFPFKGDFFASEGDYIILTPGNFKESGGFKCDIGKAKFYSGEIPSDYICSQGDLVVAMTEQAEGLLGSSAIVPIDNRFLHNQRIGLVTANTDEIDIMFLYYLFNTKSVRQQIMRSSSGSKVKHTSPDRIYDVTVNLHPLLVQRQISSVLSDLDSKIELNNRINTELEQMAKTLYDYWFVQFDFPNKDGKPYKSSGGKMIWNNELKRDIPEGWEFDKIGNRIKTHLGGTPSRAKDEYWNNGNIPWLSSGEIAEFPIFSSVEKITEKGLKNSAAKFLEKGSIMISITGNIRVSILGIDASANQSVVGIEEDDELKKAYLYFVIINNIPQFEALMAGAVQKHINKDVVDSTLILIPPRKILDSYYELLDPVLEQIFILSRENQKLSELRDWLLPMLMNGQVTVE